MTSYGYTRVPGSDRLRTQPVGAGPAAELESLDPATPTGRLVEGEWLSRCLVRDRYVPVLLEVYDRLALDQEAIEQAVYGHLYRLALADERNWCRVALKELQQRTRLSERRLNKALSGLVEKGHVRLVERDRRGTLYRVMLPHEVFGEPDHDTVHMPRSKGPAAQAQLASARAPLAAKGVVGPAAAQTEPPPSDDNPAQDDGAKAAEAPRRRDGRQAQAPAKGSEPPSRLAAGTRGGEVALQTARVATQSRPAPASRRRAAGHTPRDSNTLLDSSSIGTLAGAFLERFGERPGRTKADVVEEILGRLEEGAALPEVARALEAFGRKAPKATPVSDLARFLERQRP